MASRTPTRRDAARGSDPIDGALDALLAELESLPAPLVAAHCDRSDASEPRIRARGETGSVDAALLLAVPGADGFDEVTDRSGRRWLRMTLVTGEDSSLVVGVPQPPADAQRVRIEMAGLRTARRMVLHRERRAGDRLRQLLVTARRAVASLDLDEVLSGIVRDATQLLHGKSGDMLLLDRERQTLRVVAVWNFPPDMLGFELGFGEGVSSQAIRRRRTIQVEDYRTYEHRAPALDRYDFGAVLCAPLVFRGEAIGALNLHSGRRGLRFADADVELLTAFASHAAIAIDHARRYENEVRLGRVLADTNRELARSLAVQQRLAEQVILDGGPAGIARVLARDLGRRVAIEDHLHRVIAGAAPDGGDEWRALVSRPVGGQRTPPEGPAREPFSVAVRVGREVVGHLILSDEGELGQIDRALIDIATTGVALEFAKNRAALEVEERLRGEAMADLLSGTYPSSDAIAARAARLGYDLGEPRDVLVLEVRPSEASRDGAGGEAAAARDGRWLAALRERLAVRHPGSVAVTHAGSIVVLATPDRGSADDVYALAQDLRRSIDAAGGADSVTVAIGARCRAVDDYPRAFREAREALDLMLRLGRAGGTIGVRELGPYALLLRTTARDELEAFARRTLEPLLAHDRAHGSDLLRTLRIHLEEDRVQRRTAARCFIHVNTVVYRVRRLEELLAVSLDNPQAVFDLTLALRILDLLDLGGSRAG